MVTVGGISTDNINDISGLTLPGAKFEFNQVPVKFNASPFGGIIVIQGVSEPLKGQKYRVRVDNLDTGASYYLKNNLVLVGYDTVTGNIIHPVNQPNPIDHYYTYQPYNRNIGSVLARFKPGTNDLLRITIEMPGGATDSQLIQMDNTVPQLSLSINDNGDCTHYDKGDIIQGNYSLSDNYVGNWILYTNICNCGPGANLTINSGTTNSSGPFTVDTNVVKNCGKIVLSVRQKRIINSVRDNVSVHREKIVCINQ